MRVFKKIAFLILMVAYTLAAEGTIPWTADGSIKDGEYTNTLNLVKERLVLHYKIDSTYIYLGIEARNSGWSAIGLDPEKGMKNADIFLIFIENGSLKVLDSYSTGIYGPHKSDSELGGEDNILDAKGRINSTGYVVEFKRLLDTKDRFDRPVVRGKEMTLIYAMAKSHNIKKKHDLVRGMIKLKIED